MRYDFQPDYDIVANFPNVASIESLANEVGMYSATPAFVREHGGPIAKQILSLVPSEYYEEAKRLKLYPNCDIRIHRLYPSDYPAYPGWHCDGEFRETYFSQPDLDRIPVSKHLIGTVSSLEGGVSNTEFLCEPFTFESQDSPDFSLWQQVNEALERVSKKQTETIPDGQLCQFGARTLHRAMPAKVRGWRLFFRMSMWHKPNLGEGGCITKQEQVYKYVGHAGW